MKTSRPVICLTLSVFCLLAAKAAPVPPPSMNSEYAAVLRSGDVMAAIGLAKKQQVQVDKEAEQQRVNMVQGGERKNIEADWQALFHPEPVHTKGYASLVTRRKTCRQMTTPMPRHTIGDKLGRVGFEPA